MQFKTLFAAAATVALASAQGNSSSLATALNSTSELSTLNMLLSENPGVLSALENAKNVTILAPSNSAFQAILSGANATALNASGLVAALLEYHVINGTVYAQNITSTPHFAHTLLTNMTYSNVTGGQVVGAVVSNSSSGSNVTIISGLGQRSSVTMANVNVTNGVVHIIDKVLTIPANASDTLGVAGLTALEGALNATNLTKTVDDLHDVTIFAPNNAAFESIGSALANLSASQAATILEGHVVNGTVAYSSLLSNGSSLKALANNTINITISNGAVFADQARIVAADILISGGVVHVIDSVLNPNGTHTADTSATTVVPAFSGASSGAVPYTSDIQAASTTVSVSTNNAVASGYSSVPTNALASASSVAASAASTSSKKGAAPTHGAMGAAALFGGAAFLANM